MTPDERRSLAEQITTNPLYTEILDAMERSATRQLIYEKNNITEAQLRVQVIISFRTDLEQCLQDTRAKKGAPA